MSEALRADVNEHMLTADEKAIFHLANGFAIRHTTDSRGRLRPSRVAAMAFDVYLATIHAVLRARNKQKEA